MNGIHEIPKRNQYKKDFIMECLWLNEKHKYDGSQLQPLNNYLKHGVLGDSVVSWAGACELKPQYIIDGEDLKSEAKIAGDFMLHFILELFQYPLSGAVALQRLMGELLMDQIQKDSDRESMICESENRNFKDFQLKRIGDDIYRDRKKLNISVATCSNLSSLIHFGVNITNKGTPVPTCCLTDFGITDEKKFALDFMETLREEFMGMKRARMKVRSF